MDKKQQTILLVGDIVDPIDLSWELSLFDEDNPTVTEVSKLSAYLTQAGYQVRIQKSVADFVSAPPAAGGTVVFPLWRGGASRNRTVIVPAVCEALNLPYVGADASVQAICQDKSLSKVLAKSAGLDVPGEIVVFSLEELADFRPSATLRFPVVLKPLYSACSIGIDSDSLCTDDLTAQRKAMSLFNEGLGPVLCEEFIMGDEVSVCYYQNMGDIAGSCLAMYMNDDGLCPFREGLFTFADKLNEHPPWSVSLWGGILSPETWLAIQRLNAKLGKVDYMRVDGRVSNGKFTLIELTPDIHLSLTSAFLGGFNQAGLPPHLLLDRIISASVSRKKQNDFIPPEV